MTNQNESDNTDIFNLESSKFVCDIFSNDKKDNTNRACIKTYFFTFPRTELLRQEFLDKVCSFINNDSCSFIMIVREEHETTDINFKNLFHLHGLIKFKSDGLKKTKFLNNIKKIFPNDYKRFWLKPATNPMNVYNYLSKEDLDPLIFGSLKKDTKISEQYIEFLKECEARAVNDFPEDKMLKLNYLYEKNQLSSTNLLKFLATFSEKDIEIINLITWEVKYRTVIFYRCKNQNELKQFNKTYDNFMKVYDI